MRVLLMQPPPIPAWGHYPRSRFFGFFVPSIGIQTVATQIKLAGHDIKVVEMHLHRYTGAQLRQVIEEFQPDVVASSSIISEIYYAYSYFMLAKEVNPSIITVLGGPFGSLSPEEALRVCPELDYVVMGEGEMTVVELLERLGQGWTRNEMPQVQGLAFLDDETFVQTRDRPHVDLDDLPQIDFDLVGTGDPRYTFIYYGRRGFRSPGWSVEYSRGCNFGCRFCSKPIHWRRDIRFRSAQRVVEDMEIAVRKYGVKNFLMSSTCFLSDRGRLEDFIIEMEKRNLKQYGMGYFLSLTRADDVIRSKDLVPRMHSIGMEAASFGVEVMDDEQLDYINKETTVDMNLEAHRILSDARVEYIMLTTMWGFPNQTREDLQRQLDQCRKFYYHAFVVPPTFSPYPGTPLYYEVARKGMIRNFDYSHYEVGDAVCATVDMEVEEVDAWAFKLIKSQVFHPRWVLTYLGFRNEHGFWLALMGPMAAWSIILKGLAGAWKKLTDRLKSLFGIRRDRLEELFDKGRDRNITFAKDAAEAIQHRAERALEAPVDPR